MMKISRENIHKSWNTHMEFKKRSSCNAITHQDHIAGHTPYHKKRGDRTFLKTRVGCLVACEMSIVSLGDKKLLKGVD